MPKVCYPPCGVLKASKLLLALAVHVVPSLSIEAYYWSHKNGDVRRTGFSPYPVQADIQRGPSWKWNNPLEVVRSTPLIDDQNNIYLPTGPGIIRKFDEHGKILWTHTWKKGHVITVPALMNGAIICSSDWGIVFSLDMADGKLLWEAPISKAGVYTDTATILAYNGSVFTSSKVTGDAPYFTSRFNSAIAALDAKDGKVLWTFQADDETFNFMAATSGDGTIVFSDKSGGLYRLHAHDGKLIWKSGATARYFFSTGSVIMGANDMLYVTSNAHIEGSNGLLSAYRLADGKLMWFQDLYYLEGNQAAAVGSLRSGQGLAVVAAVGTNPGLPHQSRDIYRWLPQPFKQWMDKLMVYYPDLLRFWIKETYRSEVIAFDAQTGEVIWRFAAPVWTRPAAAGDSERLFSRLEATKENPQMESACLPDSWAAPVIDGDGRVFVGSGLDGVFYAIKDENGDGNLDPITEVKRYATGDAFLGSPAIAPGMLVAAPCGGGMYVWKW